MKNHYAVLGVPPEADARQIKRAYRSQARRVHPDVNRSPNAAAEFLAVSEAYEVLRDPARRRAYDRELQTARVRERLRREAVRRPSRSQPWSAPGRGAGPEPRPYAEPPPYRRPARPGATTPPKSGPWDLPGRARVPNVLKGERWVHFGCGATFGGLMGATGAMRGAGPIELWELLLGAVFGALFWGGLMAFFRNRLWSFLGGWYGRGRW